MFELKRNLSEDISFQALQAMNYRAKGSLVNQALAARLYVQGQEIKQLTDTNCALAERIQVLENDLERCKIACHKACKLIQ